MTHRIAPLVLGACLLAAGACRTYIALPGEDTDLQSAPSDLARPADLSISDLSIPPPRPDLTRPARDLTMPRPDDLAGPRDLYYVTPVDASGFACGSQTCAVGQQCCVSRGQGGATLACMPSCPDGGVTQISCDGPGTCGGNPCCISGGAGGFGSVACKSAPTECVPAIDFQSMALTTRLCQADGDCTAGGVQTMLNRCCRLSFQGFTGRVCLNPQIGGLLGATCP